MNFRLDSEYSHSLFAEIRDFCVHKDHVFSVYFLVLSNIKLAKREMRNTKELEQNHEFKKLKSDCHDQPLSLGHEYFIFCMTSL